MVRKAISSVPVDAVLIAGPTASGKSAAAIALAERLGGVVINADSMQIYKEARILTARPSDEDCARVPHRLFGHVSVHERYSLGRYQADAGNVLASLRAEKRLAVFAGGTGMYFGALTVGVADIPAISAEIRQEVRAKRESLGPDEFFRALAQLDGEAAIRLRASDTQRTLRAYEVILATGKPLSWWQTQGGQPVLAGLRLARFVIAPQRARLHEAINARFDAMLEAGAMAEAVRLERIDPTLPAAKILGRRELLAAESGMLALPEAVARAKAATRQYAKRQLTWFRHRMADWRWLEPAPCDNFIAQMEHDLS